MGEDWLEAAAFPNYSRSLELKASVSKMLFLFQKGELFMDKNLKNPLAIDPISKLLLRFSVPTALTLIVNYLYNIVDQIFVGQKVGVVK